MWKKTGKNKDQIKQKQNRDGQKNDTKLDEHIKHTQHYSRDRTVTV